MRNEGLRSSLVYGGKASGWGGFFETVIIFNLGAATALLLTHFFP